MVRGVGIERGCIQPNESCSQGTKPNGSLNATISLVKKRRNKSSAGGLLRWQCYRKKVRGAYSGGYYTTLVKDCMRAQSTQRPCLCA